MDDSLAGPPVQVDAVAVPVAEAAVAAVVEHAVVVAVAALMSVGLLVVAVPLPLVQAAFLPRRACVLAVVPLALSWEHPAGR